MLSIPSEKVLFQLLEVPENDPTGATSYSLNITRLVAAILSLPIFIYSLASLMVMAVAFVGDTWNGHGLYAMMLNLSIPAVEWAAFCVYIFIPSIAAIVTLSLNRENWWEITALVWIATILAVFLVFAALVVYHEIKTCFDLMKTQDPDLSCLELMMATLVVTLSQRFAGVKDEKYMVRADQNLLFTPDSEPVVSFIGPYSRATLWNCNKVFYQVDPPKRRYNIQEIREMVPFVTKNTWYVH